MNASRIHELAEVLLEMTDGVSEAEEKKALKHFSAYLNKMGMLKKVSAISREYSRLHDKKHGVVQALVTLTARLPQKEKKELHDVLLKKYKARSVHIEERVDQRLIGGMKIQVGDEVFDASLQNSLKQLQAQLLK